MAKRKYTAEERALLEKEVMDSIHHGGFGKPSALPHREEEKLSPITHLPPTEEDERQDQEIA